jgi:hypothetical protein
MGEEKEKWWGPHLEGEMEGLQKWRVGGGIWRGMQNGGLFRGPAGDGFLHQTSKFWSRGPYGGPRWRCSYSSNTKPKRGLLINIAKLLTNSHHSSVLLLQIYRTKQAQSIIAIESRAVVWTLTNLPSATDFSLISILVSQNLTLFGCEERWKVDLILLSSLSSFESEEY